VRTALSSRRRPRAGRRSLLRQRFRPLALFSYLPRCRAAPPACRSAPVSADRSRHSGDSAKSKAHFGKRFEVIAKWKTALRASRIVASFRLPLRVKSDVLTVRRSLPVCTQDQTWSDWHGMSQRCHVWTAPGWQEESSRRRLGRCCHVFGLLMRFT
jgi:hypothetical protein